MNSRRLMLAPATDKAWYRQKLAHWKGHRCPLWVKSRHWGRCNATDVRFTPESGHRGGPSACPLSAKSGHATSFAAMNSIDQLCSAEIRA
jgi:hypothetical protein